MACPIVKTEKGTYEQQHFFKWAGTGQIPDKHKCECGIVTYQEYVSSHSVAK